MASRMMHLAIACQLLHRRTMPAADRFLIGAMLPDAAASGNSHWKLRFANGKRTYDLTGFRQRFEKQLAQDPLYMGYYLHLVQDLQFRHFVYDQHHWDPAPPGNAERLHNDYAILNRSIIARYALPSGLTLPKGLAKEKLFEGCAFDFERFDASYQADFTSAAAGESFFFTAEMAEAYIAQAHDLCMQELDALAEGRSSINEIDQAWG